MEINENYFNKDNKIPKKTINDFLESDEKLLWRSKPKRISYALSKCASLLPIALIWLIFDSVFIIAVFNTPGMNFITLLIVSCFLLVHLAPVWIFLFNLIKGLNELNSDEYFITNKRVLAIKGKYGHSSYNIPLDELKKVDVKRSGIDKFFKVGDIYISGISTNVVFFDVHDSDFIVSKLQDIIIEKKKLNTPLYKYNTQCSYCLSSYTKTNKKCPICGAPNPDYKQIKK